MSDTLKNGDGEPEGGYGKTLVALAGGTLALSVLLIKNVVPFGSAKAIGLLLTSWGGLVLTLAVNVIALAYGLHSRARERHLARDLRRSQTSAGSDFHVLVTDHRTQLQRLNLAQGVVFVASMAALVLYVSLNVLAQLPARPPEGVAEAAPEPPPPAAPSEAGGDRGVRLLW